MHLSWAFVALCVAGCLSCGRNGPNSKDWRFVSGRGIILYTWAGPERFKAHRNYTVVGLIINKLKKKVYFSSLNFHKSPVFLPKS
jgi:hypothetical protein